MSWIKEINHSLRRKVDFAFESLSAEERSSLKGGCAVVALDGLLREALSPEVYAGFFRRGGEMGVEDIIEIVRKNVGILLEHCLPAEVRLFSSSPKPFGIEDLEVIPLSHRGAEELAGRIRNMKSFGALALVGKGEEKGHVLSLIGNSDTSAIFKFDAQRYPYVEKIGLREAVRTLRRAQRRG